MAVRDKTRSRYTISIDSKTLEAFRAFCDERGLTASFVIEACINGYMEGDLKMKVVNTPEKTYMKCIGKAAE